MIIDGQRKTKQVVKKFNVNLDLEDEGPGTGKYFTKGSTSAANSSRGTTGVHKGKTPDHLYLVQTPSSRLT